jgi:hypothetical protein
VLDPSNESKKPSGGASAAEPRVRKPWQFGLATVFLLIAGIAVWMTYFINRRYNASLDSRISTMIRLAPELVIDDARKIAVVKLDEYLDNDNRWDIYLPAGHYRLCIATREILDSGLAPARKSRPFKGGMHQLAFEMEKDKDVWRIGVKLDGTALLEVAEPKDWDTGSSSTPVQFSSSEQVPADRPVVLFRRRFMSRDPNGAVVTTDEPSAGVLLWIEPSA